MSTAPPQATATSAATPAEATLAWSTPTYQALGLRFRVETDVAELQPYLLRTFSGLEVVGPAGAGVPAGDGVPASRRTVCFGLHRAMDGAPVVLTRDGAEIEGSGHRSYAVAMLLWHFNNTVVAATTPTHVVLHAAAAERDGVGVVLPAPMESGKTTTVAGLMRAGWRYLTDEASAIDPATLQVTPFPKALAVDQGSWEVLADLDPGEPRPVPTQWQVPPTWPAGADRHRPVVPRLIVFPRYAAGQATHARQVRAGEAVRLLVPSTFAFDRSPQRNLDTLAGLVRQCRCMELTIGELGEAVAVIEGLAARVTAEAAAGAVQVGRRG
ncbi:MAG: hypothetical protein ACYCXA_08535 [Actinomycetes bacterium]